MANTILIKSSATANSIPVAGNLSLGELALNYADGNLFYKNSSNVVTVIASNKFLSVTGNVTGGNLLTGGLISATGNITGGNLSGTSVVGTLTTAAQTNITSVGTLTSLAVTGNISGGNLSGTSIVGTLTTAAQTNITSVGTLGSVTVTANVQGGNLLTAGQVSATGNITGGNVLGGANVNATTLTGTTVSVTSTVTGSQFNGSGAGLTSIPGANVTGTVPSATSSTTAGTVTTAAQGNITSVGTLTSLAVTGNITSGNLSGTSIVGTLTTAAQTNITSVGTLGSLSVTGNITSGNLSGTSIVGTLTTAAQTNITSVGTLGSLAVTGNITGGNLSGTSIVGTLTTAAQTNITSVGTLGSLAVTGNTTSGNLLTGGLISATGAVTGSQFNGSGAGLTSIPGANVTGTVANSANVNGVSQTLGLATSNITVGTSGLAGPQAGLGNGGGAAVISFHRPGAYAVNMGLDTDNVFKIGGWSDGLNTYRFQVAAGGDITASTFSGTATTAKYADLAELYAGDADYTPGTVLEFGGPEEVTVCDTDMSTRIIGVVSTDPAHLMNSELKANHAVKVALMGRVPCSVVGTVRRGDMMVSAGAGAARSESNPVSGSVLGKAVQDHNGVAGVIEILVGRL